MHSWCQLVLKRSCIACVNGQWLLLFGDVHLVVIFVPSFDKSVRKACHNPDGQLDNVKELHQARVGYVFALPEPAERRVVKEVLLPALGVDEHKVELHNRHACVNDELFDFGPTRTR